MKKLLIIVLVLFIKTICYSQGRDNLWMLGYGQSAINGKINIDFQSGAPIISISTRTMNMSITHANITDTNGNLLFYTNGACIANAVDDTMPNGRGLSPGTYTPSWQYYGFPLTQGALIIPDPGDSMKYYLFHETIDILPGSYQFPTHLYNSIINMLLDNGLGDVEIKNQILLTDSLGQGNLVACKHANGRDWWVIVPEFGRPGYYIYLVTPLGIQFITKQIIGVRVGSDGQSAFNRQGSKYARYDATNGLDIFDFDRCTGILSNNIHAFINDSLSGFGVGFSPDGSKVYASQQSRLYQFDLNVTNVPTSKTIVAQWDSTYAPFATYFNLQQLAPDNKLYIATYNSNNVMHYVEYPDSAGVACHVVQHGLQLPVLNDGTVPNHPNYHLGPVVGSICDSLTGIIDNTIKSADLRINPNPCKEELWINYHFLNNKDGWLEIYNSIGKLIIKRRLYWSTTQLLVHLNDLANGMYVVHVYDDSKMYLSSGKLIKN